MRMSFQEKSVWAQLVGVVLAFGLYFYTLVVVSPPEAAALGLFIAAVVVLVIIQVLLHIVIALSNTREAERGGDERDELIELRASRISSVMLTVGVLGAASLWLIDVTSFTMANAVLLSLVVAQVTGNIAQIFYYRRGL